MHGKPILRSRCAAVTLAQDELGDGVNAEELRLAMGTYLDLDLEGDDLDLDNWEGDSEGLSEEELLRATKDLLRNGS